MGEDVSPDTRLFELPNDGKIILPNFKEISPDAIPASVVEQLEFEFRIQEVENNRPMRPAIELDFGQTGKAYLMPYYIERVHGGLVDSFHSIFDVDLNNNGEVIGAGSSLIELDNVGRESTRPYVWHTSTEPNYRNRGLGLRRLVVLNEANRRFFRDSLGSGSLTAPEPVSIWGRLEAQGIAVKEDGGFRFK